MTARPGYQGRGGFDPDASLFPDLEGFPLAPGGWWTAETLAAAIAERQESQAFWQAWNASHPPDRTCPGCGQPGGKFWLSTASVRGGGTYPWHRDCAATGKPAVLDDTPLDDTQCEADYIAEQFRDAAAEYDREGC